MEEKLIKGGEMLSKVSQQEVQLSKAQQELRAHAEQQSKLARELAEKEEANLQLEEHFSSMQEEVEVKTKKLKKLWTKYQAAVKEAQDLQEEFQVGHPVVLCFINSSFYHRMALELLDGKDGFVGYYSSIVAIREVEGHDYCEFHS